MPVNDKKFENLVIVLLLLIIMALLSPFVVKIINKSWKNNFESSVYGSIESVKNLYLNEVTNPLSAVTLPFMVEYSEDSYKVYSGGVEIDLTYKLETKGLKPISGSIMWNTDSNVVVKDLRYKGYNYVCNKVPLGDVECVKDTEKNS